MSGSSDAEEIRRAPNESVEPLEQDVDFMTPVEQEDDAFAPDDLDEGEEDDLEFANSDDADPDATVLLSDDFDPDATTLLSDFDPDATVLATHDSDETVFMSADPNATVLLGEEKQPHRPKHMADVPFDDEDDSGELLFDETFDEEEFETEVDSPDGLDMMDDPYFIGTVTPEDLTGAYAPVAIESPVQSLPERKRHMPVWLVIILVIVVLGAVGYGLYYTYEQEEWGGKTIPTVVGLTEEEAVEDLEDLGFTVEVTYVGRDSDLGLVLSCSPSSGTRTDLTEIITLTVATARTIPDVVGLDVESATDALGDAGADSISLTYQNSSEEAGTVISVSPDVGEAFVSSDTITLVIAQAYTVPNVVGLTLEEAEEALSDSGLTYTVTYVDSDEDKYTVISSSPTVGEVVDAGTAVELSVSSPYPSSVYSLIEYFEASSEELSDYLADEGFTVRYGEIYASGGNAHAAYESENGDLLTITNTPEDGSYSGSGGSDVLADGASVGGVRFAFTSASLPDGATSESEEGIEAVMELCGFEGLLGTCTQEDLISSGVITVTEEEEEEEVEEETEEESTTEDSTEEESTTEEDTSSETEAVETADEDSTTEEASYRTAASSDTITSDNPHFICGYGKQGDYTWVVLIGGYTGSTKVIALVAPTSYFDSIDLSAYGGTVCSYVACVDLYGM